MTANRTVLFFLLSMCVFLTSCASVPNRVNYYSLTLAEGSSQNAKDNTGSFEKEIQTKARVTIAPIALAKMLNQDGIVLQKDINTIHQATYHRWAEPLDSALAHALENTLNSEIPTVRFEVFSGIWTKNNNYTLRLSVNNFHLTHQSIALFSGRYWIYDSNRNVLIDNSFQFNETLQQDGYAAGVNALKEVLNDLNQELANQFNQLLKSS